MHNAKCCPDFSENLGGTLIFHENFGEHTISKHVGKTDQQLLNRLNAEPNIPSSSSFTNIETAEKAIGEASKIRQTEINEWMNSNSKRLELNVELPYEVGKNSKEDIQIVIQVQK